MVRKFNNVWDISNQSFTQHHSTTDPGRMTKHNSFWPAGQERCLRTTTYMKPGLKINLCVAEGCKINFPLQLGDGFIFVSMLIFDWATSVTHEPQY